jgi:hypothetical protein
VLRPNLVQRQFQLKLYKTFAVPSLLYGCEIRTLKQRDIRRLKTTEMKMGYKKTKESRNKIQDIHSRVQFITPQKK